MSKGPAPCSYGGTAWAVKGCEKYGGLGSVAVNRSMGPRQRAKGEGRKGGRVKNVDNALQRKMLRLTSRSEGVRVRGRGWGRLAYAYVYAYVY